MKVKNLAKDKIVTLKALKLEFEKFWMDQCHSAEITLCRKAQIEKTGPEPNLRFQNENFIVAPSPSTAKDYLLHTKKYKYAFDSTIQCLQERFDQNTAGKKIVSFGKEFFFPWKCLRKRLFP